MPSSFTISCFTQAVNKKNILHVKTSFDTFTEEPTILHERSRELFNIFVNSIGRPQASYSLKITPKKSSVDPIVFKVNSNHFNYDCLLSKVLPDKFVTKGATVSILSTEEHLYTGVVFEKELLDEKTDITPTPIKFSNLLVTKSKDPIVEDCILTFEGNVQELTLKSPTNDLNKFNTFKGLYHKPIVDTHIDTGLYTLAQNFKDVTEIKQSTRTFINHESETLNLPLYPHIQSPDGGEVSIVHLTVYNLHSSPLKVYCGDNKLLCTVPQAPVGDKAIKCSIDMSASDVFVDISVVGHKSRS